MERSTPRLSHRTSNAASLIEPATPKTPQPLSLAFSPQQFRKALEVKQLDMQQLDAQFTKVPMQQHENSLTPCKGVYLLHTSREHSNTKNNSTPLTTSASMLIRSTPTVHKEECDKENSTTNTLGVFNRTQSISTKAYKVLVGNTLPSGQDIQLQRNQYSNSKLYPIYQMDDDEMQSVMTADCDDEPSEMLMDNWDDLLEEEKEDWTEDMSTATNSEKTKESHFAKLKQKLKDKFKNMTSKWKLVKANEKILKQVSNSPLKQNKTKRNIQQHIRVNQSPQSPIVKQLVQEGKLALSPSALAASATANSSSPITKQKVVEQLMNNTSKKNLSPKILQVKKLIEKECIKETPKRQNSTVLQTPTKQIAPAESFISKTPSSAVNSVTPQKTSSLSNFINLLTPRTKSMALLRKLNNASFKTPQTPQTPRTLRLTAEDEALIAQHDLDFFDTLKRPECYPFFYKFCDKERSTENVDFWNQVQLYRQLATATQRKAKSEELFHTFVDQNAPRALNIDGKSIAFLRQKIFEENEELACDLFNDLQRTVEVVMVDSFARFKISDLYKQMVLEYIEHLPLTSSTKTSTPKTPHLKRQETNQSILVDSAKK